MIRFGHFSQVPTTIAFLALSYLSLSAQDASQNYKEKPVPPLVEPQPFGVSGPAGGKALPIRFVPAEEMTQKDKLLAADAESSIGEHAGMHGFEMQEGPWSYQQVVCPALPEHLFLRYMRNNGTGDETVFTASIPRNQEGRLRVIPVKKRGYSLFSPAPINAMTIAAFNKIRSEEPETKNASWLGNALCYATLAGARPEFRAPDAEPTPHKPVPDLSALLEVRNDGSEVIQFDDAAGARKPMQWTMVFTKKGKLLKATHAPAAMQTATPVPEKSAVMETRPVPPA